MIENDHNKLTELMSKTNIKFYPLQHTLGFQKTGSTHNKRRSKYTQKFINKYRGTWYMGICKFADKVLRLRLKIELPKDARAYWQLVTSTRNYR